MTISKSNETQMSIWKKNLLAIKAAEDAKEADLKKKMESGEMYENMVSEAVGFITDRFTADSQSLYRLLEAKDGIVTSSIQSALVITPDLKLYCGALRVLTNPKTNKQYFYDAYRFKDKEQVKSFFEDVKAQLPEAVTFTEREAYPSDLAAEGSRVYDVKVKIDLNS